MTEDDFEAEWASLQAETPEEMPPPTAPMKVARKLMDGYRHGVDPTLLSWRAAWMKWQKSHWIEIEEADLRSAAYRRLEHAVYIAITKQKLDGQPIDVEVQKPWAPNRHKIADLVDAMRACAFLPETVDTPSWLTDGPQPAGEIVACRNGLLNVTTRELAALTPSYFNRVAVPFDYDRNAPEPTRWLAFLAQLWPGDPDSIKALQEWFGYVLSGRTDLQKIMLLIGPTRSGKGTIARVLAALIGRGNAAGPTLASLSTNFGLAPLLGKPLAVISDARLGKQEVHQVVERLLSISGEDMLTIDRKYREPWTGKLPARFLILSNVLPRFGDASGAIAHRFIVLTMTESFLGKENSRLTDELLTELPGILSWSLDGLDRLTRQSFTTPTSSAEAIRVLQDLVSPISAFVRDECQRGPKCTIEIGKLYAAWKDWCEGNGHKPGSVQTFGGDLRAAVPELHDFKPHGQKRQYAGVTLRTTGNNGSHRGSSGSERESEPGEPHEPHENPLWTQVSDEALPFIERCDACGERREDPGYTKRCRDWHAAA